MVRWPHFSSLPVIKIELQHDITTPLPHPPAPQRVVSGAVAGVDPALDGEVTPLRLGSPLDGGRVGPAPDGEVAPLRLGSPWGGGRGRPCPGW